MNISIDKTLMKNRIYILLFQLCVISNAVFGEDARYIYLKDTDNFRAQSTAVYYLLI